MTGRRILVTGGRKYQDRDHIFETLDVEHAMDPIVLLIHGNYGKADLAADDWAVSRGVKVERVNAEWTRYGPRAGPMRNTRMVKEFYPVKCIAFKGGAGTADCCRKARAAGIEVVEVRERG